MSNNDRIRPKKSTNFINEPNDFNYDTPNIGGKNQNTEHVLKSTGHIKKHIFDVKLLEFEKYLHNNSDDWINVKFDDRLPQENNINFNNNFVKNMINQSSH